jgi:hypothetical protein
MGTASKIAARDSGASPTAEGSSMEKKTPLVVKSHPSKSNKEQPVTRNQNFTQKKLAWKKTSSGY